MAQATPHKFQENAAKCFFFASSALSALSVAAILAFLFAKGFPAICEIGWGRFIFGMDWKPLEGQFGILPQIVGTLLVTAGAFLIGVPAGVSTAVWLSHFCPKKLYSVLRPAIELMAGVPSIVYGLFGLTVLVPMIMRAGGGSGRSLAAGALILGIMILPTVIVLAESAIRSVDTGIYEGARALGASHERAVLFTVLPAANSGLMAAAVLGIARAAGETMAVVMVCGNQSLMPDSIFSGIRTLTGNVILEMGYAEGLHQDALIGVALVLFTFVAVLNIGFAWRRRKSE